MICSLDHTGLNPVEMIHNLMAPYHFKLSDSGWRNSTHGVLLIPSLSTWVCWCTTWECK